MMRNWHPTQPNNYGNEDCAVLLSNDVETDGTWADRGCTLEEAFFCEFSKFVLFLEFFIVA